ncbi:MAG: aminotransferase class III-fold pyridoxal phosphate-dependent enzyme [Myxococcota bacterium]
MAGRKSTPLHPTLDSPVVKEAAQQLVWAVQNEAGERTLSPRSYERAIRDLERLRGRPLFFPGITSGAGRGARVRMADGTTKLDFVGGIGVQLFGHGDEDLLQTAVAAAASDVVFQGHLLPGPEYLRLSRLLRKAAGSRFRHVWLSLSGAVANENALKMIFQRHAPADHIVVFERAFHGRTGVMQELSDKPAYREGQPLRTGVLQVPFFDPSDPDSTMRSVEVLDAHLQRHPGRVAGMCFELVQGEGGFNTAPREFFAALMQRCRDEKIAVWVDEVQTFGRTGELFAYQTLDLESYVDVVTLGKTLQGSAAVFTARYNPKPGLVAGTFAGNTAGMAVGARILERLTKDGYLGPDGRVAVLGRRIEKRFEALAKRLPRAIGAQSGLGAMRAFVPFDGEPATVKAVLMAAFDEGLILLNAGANPMKIRLLPPVNVTDEELEGAFAILEKALRQVAESRGWPC